MCLLCVGARDSGTICIEVTFSMVSGSGSLSLEPAATCPPHVLPVYCNATQLARGAAGFELLARYRDDRNGIGLSPEWRPVRRVQLVSNDSVLLTSDLGLASAQRVRYAYADWPVTSIRNGPAGHSLPARVFDIAVAAESPLFPLSAQHVQPVVYPQTAATLDPRLTARVSIADSGSGSILIASALQLEVEDAPLIPQTRDPGHGRPPFSSSRLRIQSSRALQIVLTCKDRPPVPVGTTAGQVRGCKFGDQATLRGVGVDVMLNRPTMNSLAFTLPPPMHGQRAVHYYLQVNISNAADAATPAHWGSTSFARGRLFYFWIDAPPPPESIGHPLPMRENATRAGIMAGGSDSPLQTAAISKALRELATGWRLALSTGLYRSASLLIADGQGLELGPGTVLQHPAPSNRVGTRRGNDATSTRQWQDSTAISETLDVDKVMEPPPHGSCTDPAFITLTSGGARSGTGIYLGQTKNKQHPLEHFKYLCNNSSR